jgi:hypothetical protein
MAMSWLVLVLVAAPLSARQVERLSGGGWDVPGSQSVEATELLEQVPGHEGEPLAIFVEGGSTRSVDAAVRRARSQALEHPELRAAGTVQRFEDGRATLLPLVYVGPRGDLYDFTTDLREEVVSAARVVALGELLVRGRVEVGVGDGVEEQLRDEMDVATLLGHQGRRGGHVAADRVASDDEPARVEALSGAFFADPLRDGVALLDRDRVVGFGREAVLGEDDCGARADRQLAHDPVVGVSVAEHPAGPWM